MKLLHLITEHFPPASTLRPIFRKLAVAALTLWLIATLNFMLMRFMPGGPFQNPKVPPEVQATLAQEYQLDRPVWVQYVNTMQRLLVGNWGMSFSSKYRSANDIVSDGLGYSAALGALALVLGCGVGLLVGVLTYETGLLRSATQAIASVLLSVPLFLAGGLLIWLFSIQLHWLPAATLSSPWHALLPVIALALNPFSQTVLLIQEQLHRVMQSNFMMVKHAHGLPNTRILWRHGLRNALESFVALLGPMAAGLLTGSFAIEVLFALPGIGKAFVTSVLNRDYPVLFALTMVYSTLLIGGNLLCDALQLALNPKRR